MLTFLDMIESIEDNNSTNDGSWSDWDSVEEMENVYGKLENVYLHTAVAFLEHLRRNEGEFKKELVEAWDILTYGQPFAR